MAFHHREFYLTYSQGSDLYNLQCEFPDICITTAYFVVSNDWLIVGDEL